jgi:hypothetical protein
MADWQAAGILQTCNCCSMITSTTITQMHRARAYFPHPLKGLSTDALPGDNTTQQPNQSSVICMGSAGCIAGLPSLVAAAAELQTTSSVACIKCQ